jgi:hypothetical protein
MRINLNIKIKQIKTLKLALKTETFPDLLSLFLTQHNLFLHSLRIIKLGCHGCQIIN